MVVGQQLRRTELTPVALFCPDMAAYSQAAETRLAAPAGAEQGLEQTSDSSSSLVSVCGCVCVRTDEVKTPPPSILASPSRQVRVIKPRMEAPAGMLTLQTSSLDFHSEASGDACSATSGPVTRMPTEASVANVRSMLSCTPLSPLTPRTPSTEGSSSHTFDLTYRALTPNLLPCGSCTKFATALAQAF